MSHRVGLEGEVVIEQQIRDQLGVKPGWLAVQRMVEDHIEIYFVPPPPNGSPAGSPAHLTDVHVPPGDAWDRARDQAWEEAAWEKERPFLEKE